MESTRGHVAHAESRPMIQLLAMVVGGVFLLVGILGFIPGITTNYSEMQFAGDESGAELLGLFQVSVLHNAVHLLFGVLGLVMSRTTANARLFLVGGGIVYVVLWLYGLLVPQDNGANFIPVNPADDWLHLLLGVGMIAMGLLARPARMTAR